MKVKIKLKNIVRIKIILYILLFLWLLYIAWGMFLKPYSKNGTHVLTSDECKKSFDCVCEERENEEDLPWCVCKYRKWFYVKSGICGEEALNKD